jgi:hypothetical protein
MPPDADGWSVGAKVNSISPFDFAGARFSIISVTFAESRVTNHL